MSAASGAPPPTPRRALRAIRRAFRRVSIAAVAILAVGVALTVLASVEVRKNIASAQSRQMAERARTTTNLFSTVAQGMAALLTTGGVVADSTNGDTQAFRRAVASRMGPVLFSNLVLFDVSSGTPRELTWVGGMRPRLVSTFTPAERRLLLLAARTGKALVAAHRERDHTKVIGLAAGPQPRSKYVVYGEVAEPRAISFGSLGGLQFAFYVGNESPHTLLATNASTLPIRGHRLVQDLNVTGFVQQPLLIYGRPGHPLLETAAPWLVLGIGILVSLALAGQFEVVRRRRDTALALVDDLKTKNVELDRQSELNRHQALHDALTELPNRTLFRDRIEQAIARHRRTGEQAAVVLVDLDHFKEVNDTLGHQCGDRLLRALGVRLTEAIRTSDTVARLGGDEFGVLLCGTADGEAALTAVRALRENLSGPTDVENVTLEVDASFGVALLPTDGDDVDSLMRHADIALYRSKTTHAPMLYASEHDHYSPKRLQLVADLRRGIAEGQIKLLYQPQAQMSDGRVCSVEALARWQHPELGLIMPDRFIPLAEHTGMIRPLTRYVLEEALGQCRSWLDRGWEIGVAVNIGARDLLDASFQSEVLFSLRRAGVPAHLLELEITENTILSDSARARAVIMSLCGHGVRFAIDDFGAGHSSLSYLKRLPVQTLKIDKSFVLGMDANEDDAVIVQSTIALGHNLRLAVVAEGVETAETRRRLADLGCDRVQGYELGRPLPPASVERLFGTLPDAADPGTATEAG